ncbi:MAG: DUF3078 domain-containing protein [Marinilabiliaceae bacterium]|nr:DUF3078 domain-containing protein [Marinilabiliaceae bacterium]
MILYNRKKHYLHLPLRKSLLYFFYFVVALQPLNASVKIKSPTKTDDYWNNNKSVINCIDFASKLSKQINNINTQNNKTALYIFFLNNSNSRFLNYYSFYLKYNTPSYTPIKYSPYYISQNFLPDTTSLKFKYFDTKKLASEFDKNYSYIISNNDSLIIFNPNNVQFILKKIPSPHKFLLDGLKMSKKDARELFSLIQVEPTKQLKKPPKKIKYWKYSGEEVIQFSHNYNENWVKGGDKSISLLSDLRANANYRKNKIEWDNKGIHKLGINQNQNEKSRISTDMFEITSKLGIKASKKWYYSSFVDFKTQLFNNPDKNNDSIILSSFMSPAYITVALGMDYKKDKNFTVLFSPITSKITAVLDTGKVDQTRYKIDKNRKTTTRSGASINSHLNWKISSQYRLEYTFDLFYGYLNENSETQMDWEIIFNMRINRFLSTRLNGNLRYFQNESSKLQFKENFSIAFSYRF